jgi:hypothetical protein
MGLKLCGPALNVNQIKHYGFSEKIRVPVDLAVLPGTLDA